MRVQKLKIKIFSFFCLFSVLSIISCEIGLGAAVDVQDPTSGISYPPKNAIVRDTFVAAGECNDDMGIESVKVSLVNTETNVTYGPYTATLDAEGKNWTVSLNNKNSNIVTTDVFDSYKQWEIPDGNYVINAIAYDKDKKQSPVASSPVSIDNTAPVFIVSKPLAIGDEAATNYGRSFNLAGDIAEEHETSKITFLYKEYDVNSSSFKSEEKSFELKDFGSISANNPLIIAKYYKNKPDLGNEKTTLRNSYVNLYGTVDEVNADNNKDKTYYCAFELEDNARLYINPSDSGSGDGNKTSEYYILTEEVSELYGSTYSLDVAKLMQIINGKTSYTEKQISEITDVLKHSGNKASSTEITSGASSKFTLNPNNSPMWAIDGYDVNSSDVSDVEKANDYVAGNILTLSIKAGRDNSYVKPNTVIAKLYKLKKAGDKYVRDEVAYEPKTLIAEGDWTDPAASSATIQLALDTTDHELKSGDYYEIDVTGEDRNHVSLEAEEGRYILHLSASGAAPVIEFEKDLNRSWVSGNEIKDSFEIKGIITSSTTVKENGVRINTINVKNNTNPNDTQTIDWDFETLPFETSTSPIQYPFTIKVTPKSGKLVPDAKSKYTYTISIKVTDESNVSSLKVLTLFVDNKNPALNISSAPEATADTNGRITIKGTASDNESGLFSITYSVKDSADAIVANYNKKPVEKANSWDFSFNTTDLTAKGSGNYKIIIEATDVVGNTETKICNIKVNQESDTPSIILTNAFADISENEIDTEHNLFDTKSNKTIYGSVTDDDGVEAVTVTYKTSDGTETSLTPQVTKNGKIATFSCDLPDAEGLFTIKIIATDTLAETTLNTKTIEFPVAINNDAPQFIDVTPESSESNYVKGKLDVSGKIKDKTGYVKITSTYSQFPIELKSATALMAGATWSNSITLEDTIPTGKYRVTYTAENKYGQKSTHSIDYSVDNDKPVIDETKIEINHQSLANLSGWWNNGNIPVSVLVTDSGIGVEKVWYSLNGTDEPSENNTFSQSGNTWSGSVAGSDKESQTIYIHAQDKLGNVAEIKSFNVNIDNKAPVLTQVAYKVDNGNLTAVTTGAYIKADQSITVFGTYRDDTSGVNKLSFTLGGNEITPDVSYSTEDISETKPTVEKLTYSNYEDSDAGTIKYWKAEISSASLHDSLTDAVLVVKGTDVAENSVTVQGLSITKDTQAPAIVGISIQNIKEGATEPTDVYKSTDGTYYIRNTKDGVVTISGTSTDNKNLDHTELEIDGFTTKAKTSSDSSWTFTIPELKNTSAADVIVTIKAYDKSGNLGKENLTIKFDETPPELHWVPFTETGYTFRGETVEKYSSVKIGQGNYSESSYGQLTSIAFTFYYDEEGSSFDDIEYQFVSAENTSSSDATIEWVEKPKDGRVTGTLKVERTDNDFGYSEYHYYNTETESHKGLKVTGTISGFTHTQGENKKNLILIRATDKCGNKSDPQLLKVLVDQTSPTIEHYDYEGTKVSGNILTNGTKKIPLRGTVTDVDAGVKALRVNLKDSNGTKLIFDTSATITGTTREIVASVDMDNDSETEKEPVKVEFTNDYGTFTYSGYKAEPADPSTAGAPDCSLESAALFVKWELEIDPTKGNWFSSYKEGDTPSFSVEAEDWADHDGTGRESNKKVGTLLVDIKPPVVKITKPSSTNDLNGRQTFKGTVTETHDLVKLSLYIPKADTAPATEADWGKPIAVIEKSDSVPVSKLYSFEFDKITEGTNAGKDININYYANANGKGTAHVLIVAEDIAGNKNAFTKLETYSIDKDKDRPVITIADEELLEASNPISLNNPKMFTDNVLDLTIEDDDGVKEASYKILDSANKELVALTPITSGKIELPSENGKTIQGTMKIEFTVKDTENGTFASTGSNLIKLQDSKGHVYGTTDKYADPTLYLLVDTEDPIVTFEGITKGSFDNDTFTANSAETSSYANVVLGGTTTAAKVRFSVSDEGTRVDESSAKVIVELDGKPISGSPFTAAADTSTDDTDDYYITFPCDTGNGTLTITVSARDKAGKDNSDKKTFTLDNTEPVITINAPSETTYQSGATTGTGEFNEVCTLYYAISPKAPVKDASGKITNSPDTYTTSTDFSYDYVDGATESSETLSTTGLYNKCKYVSPTDTKLKLFYIYFDGDTDSSSNTVIHDSLLNDKLIDFGITTYEDINKPENPFSRVVKLYMYIKAVDQAGNYSESVRTIYVDPLGQRPVASIGYPGSDGLTLGGPITLMGTATGVNPISKVVIEVSVNGGAYGSPIEADVKGSSWNYTINSNGKYDPENDDDTNNIKIRVHTVDSKNATSGYEYRTILIDKDTPVIDQNILLVQWNEGYNGSNGVTITKNSFSLNAASYSKLRNYSDKMSLTGEWFILGKVTDSNGINSININGGNAEFTTAGETYSDQTTGTYFTPLNDTSLGDTGVSNNYYFCIPIGNSDEGYVGEQQISFVATENKENFAKPVSKNFSVKIDNKAPVLTLSGDNYQIEENIINNNGFYTFSSVANEDKVAGVEQTGVERVVFYFTRDTYSDKRLYDVMMQNDKEGNKLALTDVVKGTEGLYWKTKSVTVDGAAIKLTAKDVNIHTGGLVKLNGSIYRISTVSPDGLTITLEEAPGSATVAYFAIANVIDNPIEEGTGKVKITSEYGWGYYQDSDNTAYDDDDNMIEKLKENKSNSGSAYYWSASINSRNLDDGPVVLHYVVFDKAGNHTEEKTVECTVKNNPPRIAGLKIGTDQNGDKDVKAEDGEFITTYHIDVNKVSSRNAEVTYPAQLPAENPSSVITVKGRTVIQPEILGGNGDLKYTWTVAKQNTEKNGWDDAYYSVTEAKKFGVGTKSDDSAYATVDGTVNGGLASIILPVSRFVYKVGGKDIEDAQNQKFTFSIQDSTPGRGTTEETVDPQTATISVIMDVALRDSEAATNYIIPFYWKNLKENSVYSKKSIPSSITDLEGHIELPADLNQVEDKDGNNIFTSGVTTVYSLNPKVSGKIKIEGIARDNSLLTELSVNVNGSKLTLAEYDITKPGYLKPADKTLAADGWSVTLKQATYAEYMACGYIDSLPEGTDGTDAISYTSQKYGHVVHWTLTLDTAKFLGTTPVKTGMEITAAAADHGNPKATSIEDDDSSVTYKSNDFKNNSTAATAPAITTIAQTGGTLGNAGYTCKYTVDVVPYISGIKTYLSSKSGKDDTSEFDRTALGHYPVAATETAYFYGFNLAKGATVTDSANHSITLGDADQTSFAGYTVYPATISTFTSGEVTVTVGTVPSLNNKNFNESQGSYGKAVPAVTDYGKKSTLTTFTNFYNRRPNSSTNYTLTDDIALDVWEFNKEAAKPNPSGRIDEPIMRINPATGIIGFAFLNGSMHYAMPKGKSNSYKGDMEGVNAGDYHAGNGFNYDDSGNAYSLECEGTEGADYYVHIAPSDGGDKTEKIIDKAQETGGGYLRYKYKSSSFAATDHGSTDGKNLYMAYYNSFIGKICFRSGNSNNNWGLFSGNDNGATTAQNSQVIAINKGATGYSNYNNGGDTTVTNPKPLGGAGEFVSIDVIKGTGNNKDVVVLVWYDESDSKLKYTYNTDPLATEWRQRNNANCGYNRRYWEDAKTIFSDAGEYCQIKVDKENGIHIAAHNSAKGILKYAYIPQYNSPESAIQTYNIDTKDMTGAHLTLDVAYDKATNGKPVPYISYMGANIPKLAYLVNSGNGAVSDKFTTNWEVTYIPTDSAVADLDAKKQSNLDSRVNVGVWKNAGVITNSVAADGTTTKNKASADSGTCWGNGTANPVVAYQTAFDDANDRIETAQKK